MAILKSPTIIQGSVSASSFTSSLQGVGFVGTASVAISASYAPTILPTGIISASSQIDVRNTAGITTIATTGSNTFTGIQNITDTTNSTLFNNGALIVAGGVGITKDVNISGSLTVLGLLTAVSTSVQYVTSSQLNIGLSRITLNDDDLVRFAGLSVVDSGSTSPTTASIFWDSLEHRFIYENLSGSAYNSAIFIAGPKNTGTLGTEAGIIDNRVPVGFAGDHIDNRAASSSIRVDFPSRLTHVEAGLVITGSSTQTSSLDIAQTWSGSGITYTGIKYNATDVTSSTTSLLMDLQTGGNSRFSVGKNGRLTLRNTGTGETWLEAENFGFSIYSGTVLVGQFGWGFNIGNFSLRNTVNATITIGGSSTTNPVLTFGGLTSMVGEATNILAQRNTGSAQTFRIYNTFTSLGNYERAKLSWSGSVFQIGTEQSGSGSARSLELQTSGSTRLTIDTAGGITASAGQAIILNDAAYGIRRTTNNALTLTGGTNGGAAIDCAATALLVAGIQDRTNQIAQLRFDDTADTTGLAAFALRNSTRPQRINIYNTFTSATNYERAKLSWSGSIFQIGTEQSGSGSARSLEFQTSGSTRLTIGTTGNVGIGTTSPTVRLEVSGSDALINGMTIGLGGGNNTNNTAIGLNALAANTTGVENTAIGGHALRNNTVGNYNTAIGGNNNAAGIAWYAALRFNTSGSNNVAVGDGALAGNSTGNQNTAVGTATLYGGGLVGQSGNNNTALGYLALGNLVSGNNNTTLGASAGNAITTGSNNSIIGTYTGNQDGIDIRTGSNNIILSDGSGNARLWYDGVTNAWTFRNSNSERVRITSTGSVGIGTTTPQAPLHVQGNQIISASSATTSSLDIAQTWSGSGITYTGIKLNVTDTTSSATSNLMDLQIGGTSRVRIDKSGLITGVASAAASTAGPGIYLDQNGENFNITRGTNRAPTYVFASRNGLYQVKMSDVTLFGWTSLAADAALDVILARDAANTLAQRSGSAAQTFRIYNTFTSLADFERAKLSWSGSIFQIGTEQSGSGSARSLELQTSGSTRLTINASGSVGIGTTSPQALLHVQGNQLVTGAVTASTMIISGSGTQRLTVVGSGSAQPLFSIQGSQGELFSIVDSMSGSLFSVNDISGLPILEVFSDDTVLLGDYQAPALHTTRRQTLNTGSNVIYSIPTASYDSIHIEYNVKSGSNGRAGNFVGTYVGSSVQFTDTSTLSVGSTTGVKFESFISGANLVVTGSVPTNSWTLKALIRAI